MGVVFFTAYNEDESVEDVVDDLYVVLKWPNTFSPKSPLELPMRLNMPVRKEKKVRVWLFYWITKDSWLILSFGSVNDGDYHYSFLERDHGWWRLVSTLRRKTQSDPRGIHLVHSSRFRLSAKGCFSKEQFEGILGILRPSSFPGERLLSIISYRGLLFFSCPFLRLAPSFYRLFCTCQPCFRQVHSAFVLGASVGPTSLSSFCRHASFHKLGIPPP